MGEKVRKNAGGEVTVLYLLKSQDKTDFIWKAVIFPNLLNITYRWRHRNFHNDWKGKKKKSWVLGLTQACVCSCGRLSPRGETDSCLMLLLTFTQFGEASFRIYTWFYSQNKVASMLYAQVILILLGCCGGCFLFVLFILRFNSGLLGKSGLTNSVCLTWN